MGDPIAGKRYRIDSVDLLRGIVMVVMLLDHTRDFVHSGAFQFDPTDISRTYPTLFFTRWITHFCAPAFVFLAGTGTYFQLARGKSKSELSRFLLTRGLWLIILEITIVRLAVTWEADYRLLAGLQVIWVLGCCMIALAVLIHLPLRVVAWFGIVMILAHNLGDDFVVPSWNGPEYPVPSPLGKLWMVLHQGGAFPLAGWPSPVVFVVYPLIPWFGVMAIGYAFGRVYDWDPEQRRQKLMRWGIACIAAFVVIRLTNFYGDPGNWSAQKSAAMTVVSFLNVQKYPPSLLFLLMTLGPVLVVLSLWDRLNAPAGEARRNGVARALITFGRVPLFFYLMQWMVAHAVGYLLTLAAGKETWIYFRAPIPGPPLPADAGFNLGYVYAAWIFGVLLLYPLCKWYASFKARRNDWWLGYL